MNAKIVALARPSELNISRVLEEFLEAQRRRLAPRTLARYEAVLDLLRSYLNGYAHERLSAIEAARFERHYNAQGAEHREFCDLFGPEKSRRFSKAILTCSARTFNRRSNTRPG